MQRGPPPGQSMKFLDLTLPTPAENLACDEALLDWCETTGQETLRFWESPECFVVVGYGNRISTEVNVAECRRRGVPILRRISGGGTVVQGPGCLNYALALRIPQAAPSRFDQRTPHRVPAMNESLLTVTGTNQFVMERNRAAMEALLGISVSVQGHTDLAFMERSSADWRKFSGNAQRRRKRAVLFHGTILHGFDLSLLEALLRLPSRMPEYRRERPHREFIANVAASPGAIHDALRRHWGAYEALPNELFTLPAPLVTKYASPEWTERRLDLEEPPQRQ